MTGSIEAICRYPVKSMLGEDLPTATVGTAGIPGDRAYAVVDQADGKVASAKNPRKWGALLGFRATYFDEPDSGRLPPVLIAAPDGTSWRSDDAGSDAALSKALGREVALTSSRSSGATYEAIWPELDGLVPVDFLDTVTIGTEEDGTLTDLGVGLAAPEGGFFDVTPLHVLTTGTLAQLAALTPGASLEWRRFRPNILVGTASQETFLEDGSTGMSLSLGEVRAEVALPTMRCVMTTLAQGDLAADRSGLRAIAAHNRVTIPGLGTWACAGLYLTVVRPGRVDVGDEVSFRPA